MEGGPRRAPARRAASAQKVGRSVGGSALAHLFQI